MKRPNGRSPGRVQLLREIDEIEVALRAMGARWSDHLPAEARYELLQHANKLWALLQQAGLR